MKNFSILLFLLLGFTIALKAQPYTQQTLNKTPFKSAASLMHDYDGDGDLDIIVSRWNPAGIYLLENDDSQQFPATAIIENDLSHYIADIDAADFDNDGRMDYVVCFSDVDDGEIAWFQRLADGSYQKWTIATGKDFVEADVADFDGDGNMDIAAVGLDNSNTQCRLFMNQANLFFDEVIIADNDVGNAIDTEDIDNDGDVDIVVSGSGFVDNTDCIASTGSRTLINDGDANFTLGRYVKNSYASFTSYWETIKIVDFNNDGVQDILGFNSSATGGLILADRAETDDCGSIPGFEIDDGGGGVDVGGHFVVFDIDGNGLLDIVRQGQAKKSLTVLYQYPGQSLVREVLDDNWDNCCNPTSKMSFGDLDNDGDLDLVFPEQGNVDEDISWYENIEGKLYKHQIYGEWQGVNVPKMADWDNDGDLDIFATVSSGNFETTEDELILYENIDGENFVNWRLDDAVDYASDVELADIDGDGDLDAFATAQEGNVVLWLRNDGFPANWVKDTIFSQVNEPKGIATDDLDGDGDADLVVCSFNDDKVFGFLNDGAGDFSPIVVDANIEDPKEVDIADFDNDGDKDIAVVANGQSNSAVVYYNDGSETFSREIIFSGEIAENITVADWNADGHPDIFATCSGSNLDVVSLTYQNGNFAVDTFDLPEGGVQTIKMTDMDNDGDLDMITGHFVTFSAASTVYVSTMEAGEIVSILPIENTAESFIHGLDVGDIDNDGNLDIVYANKTRGEIVLVSKISMTTSNTGLEKAQFSLYPNPAKSEVWVVLPEGEAQLEEVKLLHINGQTLRHQKLSANPSKTQLSLAGLPSGLYFIQIQTDQGTHFSRKILKQ